MVEEKGHRSAAYQRAVEPLAVSGPTRVINRHLIELAGMAGTGTRLKDFVAETADRTFGIGRGRFHVGGSPSRHIDQRNVEYQWPGRLTLLLSNGLRLSTGDRILAVFTTESWLARCFCPIPIELNVVEPSLTVSGDMESVPVLGV